MAAFCRQTFPCHLSDLVIRLFIFSFDAPSLFIYYLRLHFWIFLCLLLLRPVDLCWYPVIQRLVMGWIALRVWFGNIWQDSWLGFTLTSIGLRGCATWEVDVLCVIVSGSKDCCPELELGSDAVSFGAVGMRLVRPLFTNVLTCHLSASSKSRITSRRCPVCGMLLILSKSTRRSSFFRLICFRGPSDKLYWICGFVSWDEDLCFEDCMRTSKLVSVFADWKNVQVYAITPRQRPRGLRPSPLLMGLLKAE